MAAPVAATQRCEPQPISGVPRAFGVSDLEANLFTLWNYTNNPSLNPNTNTVINTSFTSGTLSESTSASLYRPQNNNTYNLLHGNNNNNNNNNDSKSRSGNNANSNNTNGATAKALRVENGFDDPKNSSSTPVTNPLDHCQLDTFPLCRSTGIPYSVEPVMSSPVTLEQMSKFKKAGGIGGGAEPPLTVPYGNRYHVRLQEAWSAGGAAGPAMAAAAIQGRQGMQQPQQQQRRGRAPRSPSSSSSDELDDSFVLDVVNSADSAAFSKPIPLGQMLDLLHPIWEEEGLVELARSREQQGKPRP